jgi:hypothetical protein
VAERRIGGDHEPVLDDAGAGPFADDGPQRRPPGELLLDGLGRLVGAAAVPGQRDLVLVDGEQHRFRSPAVQAAGGIEDLLAVLGEARLVDVEVNPEPQRGQAQQGDEVRRRRTPEDGQAQRAPHAGVAGLAVSHHLRRRLPARVVVAGVDDRQRPAPCLGGVAELSMGPRDARAQLRSRHLRGLRPGEVGSKRLGQVALSPQPVAVGERLVERGHPVPVEPASTSASRPGLGFCGRDMSLEGAAKTVAPAGTSLITNECAPIRALSPTCTSPRSMAPGPIRTRLPSRGPGS